MTRDYARGPSGERVVGIVPRNRGVILTVVGAVALDGVRAMMAYEGGTSGDAFLRFCKEALAPSLYPGDIVVLDNLGAHRAVGVREAIETVGARILYLPPYHPELNPIELAWSKLKALLKKLGARDLQALALKGPAHSIRHGRLVQPLWLRARGSMRVITAMRSELRSHGRHSRTCLDALAWVARRRATLMINRRRT